MTKIAMAVAASIPRPCSALENSTMRMAFLAARR
jgi:hypothetical protein